MCENACDEDWWLLWGLRDRAGSVMVTDDGRESEPMIAFTNRILMKPHASIHGRVHSHFSLYTQSASCAIQTSYPYQTNEFHLVVSKWLHSFITMLKRHVEQ